MIQWINHVVQMINPVIKLNHLRRAELSQKPLEEVGLPLGPEGGPEWEGAGALVGVWSRGRGRSSGLVSLWTDQPIPSGVCGWE